ncbi:MAG TPA: KilA-N domain-containing protein [Rickettsiales bacterium]|nr:KilA-N domain-containing protein [Rickettsiales bacterium]
MDTSKIVVNGIEIRVKKISNDDYLCLTDMIKAKDGGFFVADWLRNRNTVEFLGIWEELNNPNFNYGEFATIKSQVGLNSYKISVKEWAQKTNAIGLISKAGKYDSGTYAQKDIALHFCTWISPAFQLYVIKEFQRLKKEEAERGNIDWNLQRLFTKENYRLHTEAIKNNIIPKISIDKSQEWIIYADEGDLLNKAVFGKTAKQWRDENPEAPKSRNIRDYATAEQLLVLTNCESASANMITDGINKIERYERLKNQATKELEFFNRKENKLIKDDLLKIKKK